MTSQRTQKTKKLTMLAMLCALAYVAMLLSKLVPPFFPAAPYLSYDAKDIIIVIGGFIMGPLAAAGISVVVATIEMFTVSQTWIIGMIMNALAACSFTCTASIIYKRKHTMAGAVMGLTLGSLVMTIVMVLWNILLTPIFTPEMTRQDIIALVPTIFIPFNLIKCGLNVAITLLLYKPVVTALRKARLIPEDTAAAPKAAKGKRAGLLLSAAVLLATCVLIILALRGVI